MCATCGCSDGARPRLTTVGEGGEQNTRDLRATPSQEPDATQIPVHGHHHVLSAEHAHGQEKEAQGNDTHHHHQHEHDPIGLGSHILSLEARVLEKNDRLAERNRAWLAGRGVLALNLMSSPGAGKTTLLERTLEDLSAEFPMAVVEGDQETTYDAERISKVCVPVVQINTGQGCHLEADMVAQGLQQLNPKTGSVVFIENVGNLVCPALFDLGEAAKIVILSVTEGEDKPRKYPHMFHDADLVLINKVDLLPHIRFDLDRCLKYLKEIAHHADILQISSSSGQGLPEWYDWLRDRRQHLESSNWDVVEKH